MTYTFKLARRLAVSRSFGMLSALVVFVACSSGDTNAPTSTSTDIPETGIYDWRPRESTPVAVHINPRSVTVETNQLIRFRASGRNRAGDTVAAPVVWSTTGGTILPDGRFSAAAVGTYQIAGRTRTRDDNWVFDTSFVSVVRRQIGLVSLEITPGNATLTPGVSQAFTAVGHLKSGTAVVIGTYWSASGGMIDPGGTYIAGDTAGTYQVIATNTTGTVADTATITISAPPSPPIPTDSVVPLAPPTIPVVPVPPAPAPDPTPPPAPDPVPPPAPTLSSVTLVPASATLAPSTTRQFAAFGRNSAGDSIPVSVVYTATGGTVTTGGLFTAGNTAGSYRIIATSGALADTSTVTVVPPLGSGSPTGIPFGPFGLMAAGVASAPYTMSFGAVTASNLASQIAQARANRIKLVVAMTGGAHSNYLTNGVFDESKWKAKMDSYNTSAMKDLVAQAVADGTIIGNSVMDEPNVTGLGDGNTWGPAGTMTKLRVDGLCAYVKGIFPTLPVGVTHGHLMFQPDKSYSVCDFFADQFADRRGDVIQYRDEAVAQAKRDRMAVMFSLNILNGGIQDRDGVWDCPLATTGGLGQHAPQCRMTPDQVRNWGQTLGVAGCAMILWRYDADYMANPANLQAFKDVAARLASAPAKSCRRS